MSRQGFARHGHSGVAAVFAFDDFLEVFERETAPPHFEQGADDGAHHVAQETVRLDGEDELAAGVLPTGFHEVADVGLHVGVQLGETGEVLVPREDGAGLVHEPDVRQGIAPVGELAGEGVLRFVEIIFVGAREGRETGVGVGLHGVDGADGDAVVQESVQFQA